MHGKIGAEIGWDTNVSRCPRFYKRMAKPRKALPQRAAMLSAALGTNETPPLVLVVLEPEVA
jgi:hypothetical protein